MWTKEKRLMISKRFKGKHPSEETRRKMSENNGMLGRHHTEETKRKMSENRRGKGHPHTEEEKIKIGLKSRLNNNIKYVQNPESRKKASLKMKGRFWVNNGIKELFVYNIPEGFIKGKLK